jgi:hypothetical protein
MQETDSGLWLLFFLIIVSYFLVKIFVVPYLLLRYSYLTNHYSHTVTSLRLSSHPFRFWSYDNSGPEGNGEGFHNGIKALLIGVIPV